jgi:hypothetical protein
MTALLSPTPVQKFFDNNGAPAAGFSLYTYTAGTSTAAPTYVDATQTTQNANPIILNARGECNLWLPPNVAYKFALQDSLGNGIWSVDQVINSQLLTLYGGVDTGTANTYVLNYTANFQTLVDGIVIYFKAANTNTGPSTLNVNGLGVVSIIQQSGQPLVNGMIPGNTLVEVMYLGGNFYLISSAYTSPQSGNFTMTPTGFNPALPNVLVSYTLINNVMTLTIPTFNGTSNNTGFTLVGIPTTFIPATTTTFVPISPMVDNGLQIATAMAQVTPGSQVITFSKTAAAPNWTASGNKGNGVIIGGLPPQVINTTVSYSLT